MTCMQVNDVGHTYCHMQWDLWDITIALCKIMRRLRATWFAMMLYVCNWIVVFVIIPKAWNRVNTILRPTESSKLFKGNVYRASIWRHAILQIYCTWIRRQLGWQAWLLGLAAGANLSKFCKAKRGGILQPSCSHHEVGASYVGIPVCVSTPSDPRLLLSSSTLWNRTAWQAFVHVWLDRKHGQDSSDPQIQGLANATLNRWQVRPVP